MHRVTALAVSATCFLATSGTARGQEPTTIIVGTVRTAVTQAPLANAKVMIGIDGDSARTDVLGRFRLVAPRWTSVVSFEHIGYLGFRYPLLQLTTDTLVADVELRTDPPNSISYSRDGYLPFVCVRIPASNRFSVLNKCDLAAYADSAYSRQIFKHNPWSPYFGRSVDGCGVVVFTRGAQSR